MPEVYFRRNNFEEKPMKTKFAFRAPAFIRFGIVVLLLSLLSGCATYEGQRDGLLGGVIGCAAGAALGGGRGCIAGGALGAGAGGIYGDQQSRKNGGYGQNGGRYYDDDRYYRGNGGYRPYCQDVAVYDNWGRFRGYRRVCN
jgi:hypothetical protein